MPGHARLALLAVSCLVLVVAVSALARDYLAYRREIETITRVVLERAHGSMSIEGDYLRVTLYLTIVNRGSAEARVALIRYRVYADSRLIKEIAETFPGRGLCVPPSSSVTRAPSFRMPLNLAGELLGDFQRGATLRLRVVVYLLTRLGPAPLSGEFVLHVPPPEQS